MLLHPSLNIYITLFDPLFLLWATLIWFLLFIMPTFCLLCSSNFFHFLLYSSEFIPLLDSIFFYSFPFNATTQQEFHLQFCGPQTYFCNSLAPQLRLLASSLFLSSRRAWFKSGIKEQFTVCNEFAKESSKGSKSVSTDYTQHRQAFSSRLVSHANRWPKIISSTKYNPHKL